MCTATAVVTVNPTPTVAAILGASTVSRSGPGITLSDATPGGIWTSVNTAYLTVGSSTGVVTAMVSTGGTYINYTVTNGFGCTNAVSKFISTSPAPRDHGGSTTTTTVGATVSIADEVMGGEWTSSDNGIATVDGSGTVSAISEGSVVITHLVTNGGNGSTINTSVLVRPLPVNVCLLPNPNNGSFIIKGTSGTAKDALINYEVTNMLGQVIYTTKATATSGVINEQVQLSNSLANGMYLLNISSANERKTIHFVIEK